MNELERKAHVFKALSDPNRLKILKILKKGEICGCELLKELNISQPTLSHHMRILCEANITKGRREGKWVFYTFNIDGIKLCRKSLEYFTTVDDDLIADQHLM
ncbi:metalloregulator ArsR/SmtB family transcription factor [Anaerobiospirillum sp. NML120448]|uniref:ArsR/SmtB family transcription factor n=1 Tax=Anaerobiospirillum sp. NML120448 TaxID=2932816 RepID=UPI001FF1FFEF|nr:metalloregulator ArsR/SmtB family transcription factor [Anaerobiospirillum sp. NML120448]